MKSSGETRNHLDLFGIEDFSEGLRVRQGLKVLKCDVDHTVLIIGRLVELQDSRRFLGEPWFEFYGEVLDQDGADGGT